MTSDGGAVPAHAPERRIEDALERIERAASHLATRHDRLRAAAEGALRQLDGLIDTASSRG